MLKSTATGCIPVTAIRPTATAATAIATAATTIRPTATAATAVRLIAMAATTGPGSTAAISAIASPGGVRFIAPPGAETGGSLGGTPRSFNKDFLPPPASHFQPPRAEANPKRAKQQPRAILKVR